MIDPWDCVFLVSLNELVLSIEINDETRLNQQIIDAFSSYVVHRSDHSCQQLIKQIFDHIGDEKGASRIDSILTSMNNVAKLLDVISSSSKRLLSNESVISRTSEIGLFAEGLITIFQSLNLSELAEVQSFYTEYIRGVEPGSKVIVAPSFRDRFMEELRLCPPHSVSDNLHRITLEWLESAYSDESYDDLSAALLVVASMDGSSSTNIRRLISSLTDAALERNPSLLPALAPLEARFVLLHQKNPIESFNILTRSLKQLTKLLSERFDAAATATDMSNVSHLLYPRWCHAYVTSVCELSRLLLIHSAEIFSSPYSVSILPNNINSLIPPVVRKPRAAAQVLLNRRLEARRRALEAQTALAEGRALDLTGGISHESRQERTTTHTEDAIRSHLNLMCDAFPSISSNNPFAFNSSSNVQYLNQNADKNVNSSSNGLITNWLSKILSIPHSREAFLHQADISNKAPFESHHHEEGHAVTTILTADENKQWQQSNSEQHLHKSGLDALSAEFFSSWIDTSRGTRGYVADVINTLLAAAESITILVPSARATVAAAAISERRLEGKNAMSRLINMVRYDAKVCFTTGKFSKSLSQLAERSNGENQNLNSILGSVMNGDITQIAAWAGDVDECSTNKEGWASVMKGKAEGLWKLHEKMMFAEMCVVDNNFDEAERLALELDEESRLINDLELILLSNTILLKCILEANKDNDDELKLLLKDTWDEFKHTSFGKENEKHAFLKYVVNAAVICDSLQMNEMRDSMCQMFDMLSAS